VTPLPPDPNGPEPPSIWTPQTVIAYLASLALFVIGLLTLSGVTVPTEVAADIQLWAGAAVSTIGGLISLVIYIKRLSLQKAAIVAGYPPHLAMRL
jgi:hypothetical protein